MRACRAGSYNQNRGSEGLRAELATTQLADGSLLSLHAELTEDAKGCLKWGLMIESSSGPTEEGSSFPGRKWPCLIPRLRKGTNEKQEEHWYTQKPRSSK